MVPVVEVREDTDSFLKPAARTFRRVPWPGRLGSRIALWNTLALLFGLILARNIGFVSWSSILGLFFSLGIGALLGTYCTRRELERIDNVTELARTLPAEKPESRVPLFRAAGRGPGPASRSDELGRMVVAVNGAFARYERLLEHMRQFTGQVSHEIRAPLVSIRRLAEAALRPASGVPAPDPEAALGQILDEVLYLRHLIERLLTLSRAEENVTLNLETVELGDLARDVTENMRVLAETRKQAIELDVSAPIPVRADRLVLRQAIINVIDNALKYSREGSPVHVRILAEGRFGVIEVQDFGPGIPEEYQARIFERFYRINHGEGVDTEGTGLGLSIVKWAIDSHDGKLELRSQPGRGCVFRILLVRS